MGKEGGAGGGRDLFTEAAGGATLDEEGAGRSAATTRGWCVAHSYTGGGGETVGRNSGYCS